MFGVGRQSKQYPQKATKDPLSKTIDYLQTIEYARLRDLEKIDSDEKIKEVNSDPEKNPFKLLKIGDGIESDMELFFRRSMFLETREADEFLLFGSDYGRRKSRE